MLSPRMQKFWRGSWFASKSNMKDAREAGKVTIRIANQLRMTMGKRKRGDQNRSSSTQLPQPNATAAAMLIGQCRR